jgi:hypothetical protein
MACFSNSVAEMFWAAMLPLLAGIKAPLLALRACFTVVGNLDVEEAVDVAARVLKVGTALELLNINCLVRSDGREVEDES